MSYASQFGGISPPKSIVNGFSSGTPSLVILASSAGVVAGAKGVTTASLSAGVLSNLLTISGRGEVSLLTLCQNDNATRTQRLQVVVDGTTVFDGTSSSAAWTAGYGLGAAGKVSYSSNDYSLGSPIKFNTSCAVNVASSDPSNGKLVLSYNVQTF